MDADTADKLTDLANRSEKERKRFYAQRPKRMADVLAGVVAKRGYAASRAATAVDEAWRTAAESVLGGVGSNKTALAGMTRVSGVSRGRLEVIVANHVVMQEINFHRPRLLTAIQAALPETRLTAIRFKVGRVQ